MTQLPVLIVTGALGVSLLLLLLLAFRKRSARLLAPRPPPAATSPPRPRHDAGAILAAITEHTPDAMIALDPAGKICAYNVRTTALFQSNGTSLRGVPATLLFAPEDQEAFARHLTGALTARAAPAAPYAAYDLTARRHDGVHFPVEIYLGRTARVEPAVVTLVVRDVTERQKVDCMKSEFVSLVSHELRTPLTSIRGSLGLLTTGRFGHIPPQARTMVEIAHNNSERLVRLINDLLDIEKMESGMMFNLKTMRLLPILETAIEGNRGFAEQFNVRIALHRDPPDLLVRVDPDRLTQVITNLLSNAIKFSPSNEKVWVEVTQRDRFVRVAVADRGPGIPVEFRGRIFQKFAQADSSDTRKKSGSGLGLSIARSIVEKMGGTISYDTTPASGSVFYFDLPDQGDADLAVHEMMGIERTHPHFRLRSRVLLRVDDRDLASRMATLLTRGGFKPDVLAHTTELPPSLSLRRYAALVVSLPLAPGAPLLPARLYDEPSMRLLPTVVVTDGSSQPGREELGPLRVHGRLHRPLDEDRLLQAVTSAVLAGLGRRPIVLHVETDAATRQVVSGILRDVAETRSASCLREARECLHRERFDLLLVEPQLADGSGLDLLPLVSMQNDRYVPVVLYSAGEVDPEIVDAVEAALVKSTTSDALLQSTVASFLRRCSHEMVMVGEEVGP